MAALKPLVVPATLAVRQRLSLARGARCPLAHSFAAVEARRTLAARVSAWTLSRPALALAASLSTRACRRTDQAQLTKLRRRVGSAAAAAPADARAFVVAQRFECLPFGAAWDASRGPAICCDGLVRGTSLQLSHWNGNETDDGYYADTSTEIALNFVAQVASAEAGGGGAELKRHRELLAKATVVNNHYDTDGLLACWTLMHPEEALARRDILVAAASAGDFKEWPSGDAGLAGLRLDAAIASASEDGASDGESYERLMQRLPALVDEVAAGGAEELWQAAWSRLEHGRAALADGRLAARLAPGGVAVFEHAEGLEEQPRPVYHDAVRDAVAAGDVRRALLVFQRSADGPAPARDFVYERPGHAWVGRLASRPTVVEPARGPEEIAAELPCPERWEAHITVPQVGILRTARPLPPSADTEEVLRALLAADPPA